MVGVRFLLVSRAGSWEEEIDTRWPGQAGNDQPFCISLSPHGQLRTSCNPSAFLHVY